MDTIFLLKQKHQSLYLGADHFGNDSNMIRTTKIILDILLEKEVIKADYLFLKHHLYLIDATKEYQDIEVTIDMVNEKIIFSDSFYLKEIDDDPSLVHVDFEEFELLKKKELTFLEFEIVHSFFFLIKEYDQVIINNKYLYIIK